MAIRWRTPTRATTRFAKRALVRRIAAIDASEIAGLGVAAALARRSAASTASERQRLLDELTAIWARIEASSPAGAEYVALRRGLPSSWEQLAALGEAGTALLSVFITGERSFLFVVRPRAAAPAVVEAPVGLSTWSQALRRLERHLAAPAGAARTTWHEELRELLEGARPLVAGARRAVVAPHREAHLVPWPVAAQLAGWTHDAEAPVAVVTIPALTALAQIRRRPVGPGDGRPLVVGCDTRGDLRDVEAEAVTVADAINTVPLLASDATVERVAANLSEAGIAHFACHARFDDESPLESGIELADGVLTARELMQARLSASLIVLSACETGITKPLAGDELAGFAQTLLFAGARSLVVSLWAVDDEPALALIRAFYAARRSAPDTAAALHAAAAEIRTAGGSDPYRWGAFCLVGDWT